MFKTYIFASVFLIGIYYLGCYYSHFYLPDNQLEKLSEGDRITVLTKDAKTYIMTVSGIREGEICGVEESSGQASPIVIHEKDISRILVEKPDPRKISAMVVICITPIAVGGIIMPIFWNIN